MKIKKTIVITGTHHTPAIELIYLLKNDQQVDWQIYYIGHHYATESHISHTIIPKLNVPFYNLDCGKFDRKNIFKSLLGIPRTIVALFQSISYLDKIKPDITVSFGGYVSVPVIVASFIKKIPSITHEQTLTNSLSTNINSYFVNKIALSFDNYAQYKQFPASKIIVTGNLIRRAIFDTNSLKFKHLKKQLKTKPLIYITGGNQGSDFLNKLVDKILPKLNHFTIIHQTGNRQFGSKDGLKSSYANYHPFDFIEIEDIGWVLNNTSIFIGRSGANTCQEINLLNLKSILIPLPFTQQNEQLINAMWVQKNHPQTTVVLPQVKVSPQIIIGSINKLLPIKSTITTMEAPKTHPLFQLIHELF